MAILKIARMGHPVLARPADSVPDPTAPEIHDLIRDMVDTMIDAPGQGLAAPQVHVSLRVAVFLTPPEGDPPQRELVTLVNPSRSEEHTSELQSLMRISYAFFCLKKKNTQKNKTHSVYHTSNNNKMHIYTTTYEKHNTSTWTLYHTNI